MSKPRVRSRSLSCTAVDFVEVEFTNKNKNRVKLLYFDGTGTWVAAKRLEKGRFSWPGPSSPGQRRIKLQTEALQLLLDGVDLRGASFKPWYERPE